MRQVRKAEAERDRRPGVDRRQADQHRTQGDQNRRVPREPHRPAIRAIGTGMIIERAIIGHQREGRITNQRRHPRRRERIGAADMRIERAEGEDIADGRKGAVDHEHETDQPIGERDRVMQHLRQIAADEIGEPGGHDREHEGEEKRLHPPAAQMVVDRLAVVLGVGDLFVEPHQPRAECPGAILGLDEAAVDPQHVRDRAEEQHRRGHAEAPHRERETAPLVGPVKAPGAIDQRNAGPGEPQARQLGQRNVERLAPRFRRGPVDPGRGTAVDPVDEHRPQHHRQSARGDVSERRKRAIHAEMARDRDPDKQPREPRQPTASADGGYRAGIGSLGRTREDGVVEHHRGGSAAVVSAQ